MKHAAFSRLSIAFALLFSLWGSAAMPTTTTT
jgi:hypothetical protein